MQRKRTVPYNVESHCSACGEGDTFIIGNWPEHLGVYVCPTCQKVVNVPLDTCRCPGCGQQVQPEDCYDYGQSMPYLGGKSLHPLEPGPECPRCGGTTLTFLPTAHLNMLMVVMNAEKARAYWQLDYMEKALFMNSSIPVIHEFNIPITSVFAYFNLNLPRHALITRRISYPIMLDIRTHLMIKLMTDPGAFGND
ncbi:MAG: hypothetical protein SF029_06605 [bacterium]|nr:hypothetical protein [bacterium]